MSSEFSLDYHIPAFPHFSSIVYIYIYREREGEGGKQQRKRERENYKYCELKNIGAFLTLLVFELGGVY